MHRMLILMILASNLVISAPAWAEGDDPGTGELRIKLSLEYAVPFLDGAVWEQHTFESPTLLSLQKVEREKTYEFELRPASDQFEPFKLAVDNKCWKLKRIERNVRAWICEKVANFKKINANPKPATIPAPQPPVEPDDVPPMPPDAPPAPPDGGKMQTRG